MKPKLSVLMTGAAIIVVAVPNYAADRYETGRPATQSDLRSPRNVDERLTYPAKASDVMGMEVQNLQNEKLGKVDELGVDVEAGRVTLVIISSGGLLGVGAKSIAVPPRALSYDLSAKTLRLDADKERFKGAPAFERSNWNEAVQTNQLFEVYRYYSQQPYFTRDNSPFSSRLGRVEKASKVIGMAVVNNEDKKCGDVSNLIVDLPMGRIVHVIVSSGGFLGIGDALNAVPPGSFRYNAQRDSLVLNVSKEQLTSAPRFKSTEWPDFGDPAYSEKVYQSYGADPYFNTDADNTRRNVRDRQDNLTPIDQGTSEADVQTTRRIRQEILAREGLSVNARNVKVITVNGKVTLRGPVNTEAEKQAIADIARRIAQGVDVDNQIEVEREPGKE